MRCITNRCRRTNPHRARLGDAAQTGLRPEGGLCSLAPVAVLSSKPSSADSPLSGGPLCSRTTTAVGLSVDSVRVIGKIGGWVVAALGLLATAATYFPSIDIEVAAESRSNDPFSAPFVVRNSNFYPLYDLDFSCGILKAKFAGNNQFDNWKQSEFRKPLAKLPTGMKETIDCPSLVSIGIPLLEASVIVEIEFRSVWWPRYSREFCFQMLPVAVGGRQWLPSQCPAA